MTTSSRSTDLVELTVAEAAAALRRGDTSPVELTDAYLERIDAVDPQINAYVTVTSERARDDAKRAADELARGVDRGPLHGIPVALKDLIDTAGIPTTGGAAIYRDRRPNADATVAARLRDAGAVLLGKTNTHELAFGVTTTNPHFGTTRNPWDKERIPGGSSGGSAAAVAAGLAAAAIGTDTGGSIRIPASFCGCVGIKATFGLVPKDGVLPLSLLGDHVGPITRTVRDSALVLGAIAGYAASDPTTLPVPVPDYTARLDESVAGLRIGLARAAMWSMLDDEVRSLTEAALGQLEAMGATVVDIELPDHAPVLGMPGSLGFFSLAVEESRYAHREGWSTHPDAFGQDLAALYSMPTSTGAMMAESLERMYRYAAAVRCAFETVDLIASPTVPIAAPPIGTEVVTVAGMELPLIAVAIANTAPFNIARNPALSVPCGFTSAGLPVGLQLAGRPLDEVTVLRVAHIYEQANPWHQRRPQ